MLSLGELVHVHAYVHEMQCKVKVLQGMQPAVLVSDEGAGCGITVCEQWWCGA